MVEFRLVKKNEKEKIISVSLLAKEIWESHYTPIIGEAQVSYMIKKYQSFEPILNQINEGYQYYLVIKKDIPIGYFAFLIKENDLFISKIYLKSEYRRKGIGQKIFSFIEQSAKKNKKNSMYLTVNKYNEKSIKAYEKAGFVNEESIKTDIGNGFFMDDYVFRYTII